MKIYILLLIFGSAFLYAENPNVLWEHTFYSDSIQVPSYGNIYETSDGYYFEITGPDHYFRIDSSSTRIVSSLNYVSKIGHELDTISFIRFGALGIEYYDQYRKRYFSSTRYYKLGKRYNIIEIDDDRNVESIYRDTVNPYFPPYSKPFWGKDTIYYLVYNDEFTDASLECYDYNLTHLKSYKMEFDSIPYPVNFKWLDFSSMNEEGNLLFAYMYEGDPDRYVICRFANTGKYISSNVCDRYYDNNKYSNGFINPEGDEIYSMIIEYQPTAKEYYTWQRYVTLKGFDKDINKLWETEIEFEEDYWVKGFTYNKFTNRIIIFGTKYLEPFNPKTQQPRISCFFIGEYDKDGNHIRNFEWIPEGEESLKWSVIHKLHVNSEGNYVLLGTLYSYIHIFMAEIEPIPTSVEENYISESNFTISPNPASDYIEITISNKGLQPFANSEEIAIYDVLGNVVWKSNSVALQTTHRVVSTTERIDISHLPSGVYFVRIGERVEKFVKK